MAIFESDRVLTIDIGASKVILAEFLVSKGGNLELLSYGIGEIGSAHDSESDRLAYIASAVSDIMREQDIKPAPRMMTVSGKSVFPRFIKLPPVSSDKINQIVQYEAEQNVPFPLDEVVWDYQLLGDDDGEMNVMLVAIKTENVRRLTDCLQAIDLEPTIVDVAPMALYNSVRYNYPDLTESTMILDMGAKASNLIFIEENRIFNRSIPVAGNAITQDLMKEFDVSFKEAEALKKEHAFVAFGGVYAGPDNEVAERVSKIVRSVLTRLHAEVNRSINFYRSQQGGSRPTTVLLTGGTSVIPHVDTFLREKLNAQVLRLNPFINVPVSGSIDADRINADVHCLAEVVGLALRRALTCPVELNLMPPEIVARRIMRKRLPFFAVSAVGLVLIMLCWWIYFHKMGGMLSARVEAVQTEDSRFSGIKNNLSQVLNKKDKALSRLGDLSNVVNSRTDWIEIFSEIHSCMDEGMWLTELVPVTKKGKTTHIEITMWGFADKLVDDASGTATEHFRDNLRNSEYFTDKTDIIREWVVEKDDYLRTFAISAALTSPIDSR
ncbi:type IV pilus assembly protein PilM [PVC group bacterium]|nr:type IV pilus assembly protein PilM [PVC group bacterium]